MATELQFWGVRCPLMKLNLLLRINKADLLAGVLHEQNWKLFRLIKAILNQVGSEMIPRGRKTDMQSGRQQQGH